MDWLYINTVEELKKLGKFNEVKRNISKSLNGKIKFTAKSWVDLLEVVSQLQKFVEFNIPKNDLNSGISYFKTEADKIIFYLIELSGEVRQEKLKITEYHFKNIGYATQWYKGLIKIIDPDICKHPNAEQATAELNSIYERMKYVEKKKK